MLEYLDRLTWDGVSRLDKWLSTYAGVESTEYTDAIGALMLIAAVRRIRHPGCKFDEMPVLESDQGKEKSTALRIMAVNDDWFSDDVPLNDDGKRVIEALRGRWFVEAAELNGMRKGEVEHLKAFLSRSEDRARMSYDCLCTEVKRQCVIIGTTNSSEYLRDSTGNRRFWPVKYEGNSIVMPFAGTAISSGPRRLSARPPRVKPSDWTALSGWQLARNRLPAKLVTHGRRRSLGIWAG